MAARHVRVVSPDERKAKPKTLAEAVEGGNYLEILLAQRREIVSSLPEEKGPAKAALHRQLAVISKEIETIEIAAAADSESNANSGTADNTFDASAI